MPAWSRTAILGSMTLLWFVIWLIFDHVGAREPLLLDPANVWTATLLAAVALDLSARHARVGKRS
jgi:hypothetical protein